MKLGFSEKLHFTLEKHGLLKKGEDSFDWMRRNKPKIDKLLEKAPRLEEVDRGLAGRIFADLLNGALNPNKAIVNQKANQALSFARIFGERWFADYQNVKAISEMKDGVLIEWISSGCPDVKKFLSTRLKLPASIAKCRGSQSAAPADKSQKEKKARQSRSPSASRRSSRR